MNTANEALKATTQSALHGIVTVWHLFQVLAKLAHQSKLDRQGVQALEGLTVQAMNGAWYVICPHLIALSRCLEPGQIAEKLRFASRDQARSVLAMLITLSSSIKIRRAPHGLRGYSQAACTFLDNISCGERAVLDGLNILIAAIRTRYSAPGSSEGDDN